MTDTALTLKKHTYKQKIYYADTDSYGVVWHGAFCRWLEAGRCEFSELMGLSLEGLKAEGIMLPVVEMNIRYKASAFVDDVLEIETCLFKVTKTKMTFSQKVSNAKTGAVNILAEVTVVAIDADGKIIIPLPEVLTKAFSS